MEQKRVLGVRRERWEMLDAANYVYNCGHLLELLAKRTARRRCTSIVPIQSQWPYGL